MSNPGWLYIYIERSLKSDNVFLARAGHVEFVVSGSTGRFDWCWVQVCTARTVQGHAGIMILFGRVEDKVN